MEDSTGVHMITDTVVCARDGGLSKESLCLLRLHVSLKWNLKNPAT